MTRVDQLRPRGRALFAAQRRATREQKGHQLFLHACGNRMDARRREAKRVGAAAVHVSRRVDVSARAEKELGDFHDIFRRPLAKSFYAVRADVVEQRRMMFARRACADEPRTCAQQPLECRDVADDDGVDRRFELRDRRTRVLHRVGKCGELIPALEVMFSRDDGAGIAFRVVRCEAAPP